MHRAFAGMFPLTIVFGVMAACGGGASGPKPASPAAASAATGMVTANQDDGVCDGKTCDDCVRAAGCWWRAGSKQCLSDDEAQKSACVSNGCVNDADECD